VGLELIIGPANAGKVAELYGRYLDALDAGLPALLVVPGRAGVVRAERDLLARRRSVLGSSVGTFDDVFRRAVALAGRERRVLPPPARGALLRRLSARHPAMPAEALPGLLDRLGSALVDPPALAAAAPGPLADAYADWWALLDAAHADDAARVRVEACRLLESSLEAWDGAQLFAEGFEDLSAAQEAAVRLVAARAGAVMTLPYEPGRPAFAALAELVQRLADLPGARIVERPAAGEGRAPALAAWERRLFDDVPATTAPGAGAPVEVLEAAGGRAEAELVVDAVLHALRGGAAPADLLVVVPHDPATSEVGDALRACGVPVHVDGRRPLGTTPLGAALAALLRAAWDAEPARADLFEFLRSPWSGIARRRVDSAEARVRGRGIRGAAAVEAAVAEALAEPLGALVRLRSAPDPVTAVAETVRAMLAAAHGLGAAPPGDAAEADAAAAAAVLDTLSGLRDPALDPPADREDVRAALARTTVRAGRDGGGRVRLVSAREARGVQASVVVVAGLEDAAYGTGRDVVAGLEGLLSSVPAADLARHRVYTAVTRARERVVLVVRRADDDGRELPPSHHLDDLLRALGSDPPRRRRGLGDLTWDVDDAPTPRARARAVASLVARAPERARRVAHASGLTPRIERARESLARPTAISDKKRLRALRALDRFNVTALDRFGDCSAWWFVERMLDPRTIDASVDNLLTGSVAHTVLHRFYRSVPATFGKERLEPADADRAEEIVAGLVRDAVRQHPGPTDGVDGRLLERRLIRDLGAFVRREAEHPGPLAATRFEVSFGGAGAAPGLKDGLRLGDFAVVGKIDRIDTDPGFSARGLVHDYKSGTTAHSAARIRDEGRLQLPLYLLALRELLGLEPVGGLFRAVGQGGLTRGLLDGSQEDALPPDLYPNDVLDPDAFQGAIDEARATAARRVARIRRGDIRHDPRGGTCPSYCPWAGVCRVPR
jgi:hypothetical protein